MGLTRSERHNRMMDRIFEQKKAFDKDPVMKSIKKNRVKTGKAYHYKGEQYPGKGSIHRETPKMKALKKRTEGRSMGEAMSSGLKGKNHFS